LNKSNCPLPSLWQATVPVWRYLKDGNAGRHQRRRPAPAETLSLLRAMTKHVRKHRVACPGCGGRGR